MTQIHHVVSPIIPNLSSRSSTLELLDFKRGSFLQNKNTLRNFRLLNTLFSRSRMLISRLLFPSILKNKNRVQTILDLGSGGCDIPIWFYKKCQLHNIKVKITCTDNNKDFLKFSRSAIGPNKDIKIIQTDLLKSDQIFEEKYDYIISNHFLHHAKDSQLITLLKRVEASSKKGFLLMDLSRSYTSYTFFALFGIFLFPGSFSYNDGLTSIKRAFTKEELNHLVQSAHIKNCTVGKVLPSRLFIHKLNKF